MDENKLEAIYQENLEERIISYLTILKNISYEEAMEVYYTSKLCDKIHNGEYDIQYLDYKVLAEMICEEKK